MKFKHLPIVHRSVVKYIIILITAMTIGPGIRQQAFAQYVTIPDPNFRTYLHGLFPSCFSGNDMDTTCMEVINATVLSPENLGITNLDGIQYFDSLHYLYCGSNNLTSLPPLPHKLIILGCTENQLISLPDLPVTLTKLLCENNLLSTLPILPGPLYMISAQHNLITTLPALNSSLQYLYVDHNLLTTLPPFPNSLVVVTATANQLTSLPDFAQVGIMYVDSNQLTSLPVITSTMEDFTCSHNQLTAFAAGSVLPTLLNCSYNQFSVLPPIPFVYKLDCSHNFLTYLPPLSPWMGELHANDNLLTILPPLPLIPDSSSSIQFILDVSNNPLDCLPYLCNNIDLTFCNTNITCLPNLPPNSFFENCTASAPPVCPGGGCVAYNVEGYAFIDNNDNCVFNNGEAPLQNKIISINGGQSYVTTDSSGHYFFYGGEGTYQLSQVINYPQLWDIPCYGNSHTVNVLNQLDTFNNRHFPNKIINHCAYTTVDIGTSFQRLCVSDNYYVVNYCNLGTDTAENSYIEIEFDPEIIPLSSTLVWSSVTGNTYTFNLGNLAPNQCGTFTIFDSISCDAILGQTACVQAHIYPDTTCEAVDPLWDHSNLRVSGYCNANMDSVIYTVKNSGTGDMTGYSSIAIYEDDLLLLIDSTLLPSGDSILYSIPASGKSYRLEAEQSQHHPGNSNPRNFVELCGGPPYSLGYIVTTAQDDADDWIEIDCHEIKSSFDPNEKSSQPSGITSNHYIYAGNELDYIIQFQNTGNDTAFNINVFDTLDALHLDVTSLQPGVSSHPYSFSISGQGIVKFQFTNILLPDSTINSGASHGFVKFKIRQKDGNFPGVVINNKASIYFDYNDPVITNNTFVTIHEAPNYTGNVSSFNTNKDIQIMVWPNPFDETVYFKVLNSSSKKNYTLELYDIMGKKISSYKNSGSDLFTLKELDLSPGAYCYKIFDSGALIAGGKIMSR